GAGRHRGVCGTRNLVGRYYPGPKDGGSGKVLARGELRSMALPISNTCVVVTAIAGDVLQGALLGHVASGLADDDRKLRFEIEVIGHPRFNQRLQMAHLRIGVSGEDRREAGFLPARLLPVRMVIQAHAKALVRVGNHRKKPTLLQPIVGCRLLGYSASLLNPLPSQQCLERWKARL